MKELKTEVRCDACNGTGSQPPKQSERPARRIFPPKCKKCGGRGRISVELRLGIPPAKLS